jgi:photosystem II stability/assembly factor-like uncharacterized protein
LGRPQVHSPREGGTPLRRPVNGKFVAFATHNTGETWTRSSDLPAAREGESLFAASNSALLYQAGITLIVTGGPSGSRSLTGSAGSDLPFAVSASGGAFSVAAASSVTLVAVGGDYQKPENSKGTAAFTTDGGQHWTAATTPPHGYRSSVAYDSPKKTWIAVGPNGTNISIDDGRNWRPLKPSSKDTPDADRNWNALSLPFVVGPKGRIGKLNANALR